MHKTSDEKEKLIYKTENPSSAEGLPIFFFSDVPHLNPQKRTGSTSTSNFCEVALDTARRFMNFAAVSILRHEHAPKKWKARRTRLAGFEGEAPWRRLTSHGNGRLLLQVVAEGKAQIDIVGSCES